MADIVYKEGVLTQEVFSALSASVGWPTTEPETAARAVCGTRYAVCAFDGENAVGMARMVGDGTWSWYIEHVVVLPEYQGRGIGTRLMEHVVAALNRSIPKGQGLSAALTSAPGKEGFYTKFGFSPIPSDHGTAMGVVLEDKENRRRE
ncbi:MAG: GNAT family N-acetyltransferase [Oscillospiraceae bacterium]|jgi:GNAT superfamily N-acetyltransferase|nr:GNAT family N-acetyltransferase [Oscillospiraceae bacterium]